MSATKKRGRPPYQPSETDRKRVELLAGVGNSHDIIAKMLGISRPTLELHFAHELETGISVANSQVAANLFRQATKDDPKAVPAAIFWLKTRAGWSEYGPIPRAVTEKDEKLGKKAQADLLARHPDENTPMGALMARRRDAMN